MTDRGTEIERVKNALSPLVNEEMDAEMRDTWLTDLATAAIESMSPEDEVRRIIEWAFEKSRVHHQLAHDNEHLRTEHIASSAAYREVALELQSRTALTPNPCGQGDGGMRTEFGPYPAFAATRSSRVSPSRPYGLQSGV